MDSSPLGKPCPPGKVRHPKTGKCRKEKPCPAGKIRNPKTFRCVTDISTAGRFINANAKLIRLLSSVSRTMRSVKVSDDLLKPFKLEDLSVELVVKNKGAAKKLVKRMSSVVKKVSLKKTGKKLSIHLLNKDENKAAKVLELADVENMVNKAIKKLEDAKGDDRNDLKALLGSVYTIVGGVADYGLNMYHGAVVIMEKKFQAGLKKLDVTGLPKNSAAALKPEVVSALYDLHTKLGEALKSVKSVTASAHIAASLKALSGVAGADKAPTTEELAYGESKAKSASEALFFTPASAKSAASSAKKESASSESEPKLKRLRKGRKVIEDSDSESESDKEDAIEKLKKNAKSIANAYKA